MAINNFILFKYIYYLANVCYSIQNYKILFPNVENKITSNIIGCFNSIYYTIRNWIFITVLPSSHNFRQYAKVFLLKIFT